MASKNIRIDTVNTHRVLTEIREIETRGLEKIGPSVENSVRTAAPQGPTGNLKKGVGHEVSSKYSSLNVFVDGRIAPHHHLVEFGTVHSRANPYMRGTIEKEKRNIFDSVAQELERDG